VRLFCVFGIFPPAFCVVSTSASDCLERLVSKRTCYLSSGRKTRLTHSFVC